MQRSVLVDQVLYERQTERMTIVWEDARQHRGKSWQETREMERGQ